METLLSFIQEYGYLFIFAATLLEGETVVALAGFAAFEGYLTLEGVIFAAFLGGMIGDQVFFYFGRFRGTEFVNARPKLKERARKIHRLMERYQNLLIFGSRFMYGFRMLIPVLFGTSRVSGLRFLIFNLLGAAVWSAVFSSIGYFLGSAIETYITHFHRAEKYVLLGLLAGAGIVLAISFIFNRIQKRVEKAEERVEILDNAGNEEK
jgi:membrane protein DedA with SNARE-associated domain